jgi:glycosyltransferase involved in cell wall biosynthesis
LIGPVLPPKGGVSVHIERLSALLAEDFAVSLLDESRNIKPSIPNLRRISPVAYLRLIAAADVVHVHSFPAILKLLHVVVARLLLKRTVLTVHSARGSGLGTRLALRLSATLAHEVIAVSDSVGASILAARIVPAFIPPSRSEFSVSDDIARWIADRKAEGRFVFASNAYRLERFEGEDLYGLDLIIDAFLNPEVAKRCACVFVVGAPDFDPEMFERYQELVRARSIEHVMLLHPRSESFCGIAALADGTIRATLSDGDALSIRESLYLGKVTIASDAASRPKGTWLFKSRNSQDLVAKIVASISRGEPSTQATTVSIDDYRSLYVGLYDS